MNRTVCEPVLLTPYFLARALAAALTMFSSDGSTCCAGTQNYKQYKHQSNGQHYVVRRHAT